MTNACENTRVPRWSARLLGALSAALAALCIAVPASALADPVLEVTETHVPPSAPVPAGTHAIYTIAVTNTGDAATSGAIDVDFTLPAGLRVTAVTDEFNELAGTPLWSCAIAGDAQSTSCAGPEDAFFFFGGGPLPVGPGSEACTDTYGITCRIIVTVRADENAPTGPLTPTLQACTPSATPDCDTASVPALDIVPFEFRLVDFDATFLRQSGDPENRAGGHPHTSSNEFHLSTLIAADGREYPTEQLKDATARLPPGLVGNPQAYPTCTQQQLVVLQCPPESQVGLIQISFNGPQFGSPGSPSTGNFAAIYNMEVPFGLPALFGFNYLSSIAMIYAELRTGDDYGLDLTLKNNPQLPAFSVEGARVTFWGVPADPAFDSQRGHQSGGSACAEGGCSNSSSAPLRPFVSLPTSCVGPGPNNSVEMALEVTSWLGGSDGASAFTHDNGGNPIPGAEGCNALAAGFARTTLEARPTTNAGDAPSGLDVDLRIPQNDDPNGLATAHLRDTTVTLPEGLVINPSGANGLDGCSPAEVDLRGPDVDSCPAASRVATVEVETPLLERPMPGSVYVADPYDNPFNSLLALYIVVDDPKTGIVVKLAGEVSLDPNTGRISATFEDNPQLPFENFRLRFFGGAGGALRTPAICGNHTTTSSMTPWSAPDSGPPADPSDTWQITQGCAGSPAEQPHAPSFDAGAVSPVAGAHSPFVVHLRREDGSQNFSAITVRPPLGLTAKLAGTPACSDAALAAAANKSGAGEKASPSCPAASEVGDVTAGAGAGPAPYYAHGKVYLAGPYKGAPISLATVIPATAGPFDLGTVVTRIAAHINPATAEITAESDPIPSILQGIPLDVKTVDVSLDKPDFSLNPTNCSPMAVDGLLTSTLGALANLSSRFQLGECDSLGFAPKMAIRLKGGTKRGKYPQLSAYVLPRAGDANIRSVSVAFPRSEFLENAHIRTICTRPDFAADRCPAGAVYGTSTVFTPIFDFPLTGNVYLRSSDNLLPDIVPDLRGPAHLPVRIEAAGRTDSIRGGIRSTFDFIPDAPFTRAVVRLQGGNKGLLVNSRNICARTYRALVKFTAHDGDTITRRPKVVAVNCKKKRRKAKRRGHTRSKGMALATRSSVR